MILKIQFGDISKADKKRVENLRAEMGIGDKKLLVYLGKVLSHFTHFEKSLDAFRIWAHF